MYRMGGGGEAAVSDSAKGQWHQKTLAPSKNHKCEWKKKKKKKIKSEVVKDRLKDKQRS